MTDEEQRITIAEAVGWERDQHFNGPLHWHKGSLPPIYENELPDFLNDLNAIHAAELTLEKDSDQLHFFAKYLWQAMQGSPEIYYGTIHATARQRSEAFLKTLGLWK